MRTAHKVVKLFLKWPTDTQELVQEVLSLATQVSWTAHKVVKLFLKRPTDTQELVWEVFSLATQMS